MNSKVRDSLNEWAKTSNARRRPQRRCSGDSPTLIILQLDCPRSKTYSVFWSLDDLCGHGPSLWEDQTSRPSTWLMIGALYARQTRVSSLVLPSARACPPPRVSLLPARPSLDSLASESSIPLSSRHRVSLRPKWLQDEQPPLIKTIKPLRADLSASSFALSLPSSSSRLRTD